MANRITYKIRKLTEQIKKPETTPPPITPRVSKKLTSLITPTNVIRLPLKHGCFNAGLIEFENEYVCVYRPDEYSFAAVILNSDLEISSTIHKFKITNCADPRLIWNNNKLFMIYSSTDESIKKECIRGTIIMDLEKSKQFIQNEPFRVSPPGVTREKNWMPFEYENEIYLIASINPHIIYKLNKNNEAEKVYETKWISPWFNSEFLRGNTNAVRLPNGNYLSTFHTVEKMNKSMHYYDNGCYVFEGKPPFKVLKCANRTYLKAEDAVEPHFRKKGLIQVCFPVGMLRKDNNLLISYGDNDSSVKILKTTVEDMLQTTIDVY